MKTEIRKSVKEHEQDFSEIMCRFRETHDANSEYELRRKMTFDEVEDIDFEVMDFYFCGVLSNILRRAKSSVYMGEAWPLVYARYRFEVARYVGWGSFTNKERHPMLHSSEAYDLVTARLENACLSKWYEQWDEQKGEAK